MVKKQFKFNLRTKLILLIGLVLIFVLQVITIASSDNGLIAYWNFDNARNNTAEDSSGNKLTGYVNKLTWGVLGKVNYTLIFSGQGYIVMDDHDELDFDANDSFTISAWVKLDDQIGGYKSIVGKADIFSLNGYMLRHDQNGYLSMRIVGSENAQDANAIAKQDYRDDKWHHLVGVIDRANDTNTIYVDGLQRDQISTVKVGDLTNNSFFYIGALARGSVFKGFIDEVRVHDRALSLSEVRALYTQDCDCSDSFYSPGDLLQATNCYKVYYLNKNYQKKWIINQKVFDLYGNKVSDVIKVTSSELAAYPTVNLMRAIGHDKVYLISNDVKQWIKTAQEFESLGYQWEDIDDVLAEELAEYQ
ncbi:MAG: hypothetical protein CMI55_02445 [Parcubacteria group bacterium]|jgi:hypothetical protein|nr:hypothetical protein [Parcubacteria group bacterium]|tara:strand:- start:17015 stop:18097 length:1083 start_codon:yes stop_codon:yes gene_type:complete